MLCVHCLYGPFPWSMETPMENMAAIRNRRHSLIRRISEVIPIVPTQEESRNVLPADFPRILFRLIDDQLKLGS